MKVTIESDIEPEQLVADGLKCGLQGGGFGPAFTVLSAMPEIARSKRITELLGAALWHRDLPARFDAAQVLAKNGFKQGIDHLVFNAVAVHPILDAPNPRKFTVSLAPFADRLNERHIDLLVNDLYQGHNDLNCVALSIAPSEIVTPRVLPLLWDAVNRARWRAAFVLGWHKDHRALPSLMEWISVPRDSLESTRLNPVVPAFLAVTSPKEALALEALADVANPRYRHGKEGSGIDQRIYAPSAEFIVALRSRQDAAGRRLIWDERFRFDLAELTLFNSAGEENGCRALKPALTIHRQHGRISFASFNQGQEFLAAYFSDTEREDIARVNVRSIDRLFDREGVSFQQLLDGRYLLRTSKMVYSGFEQDGRFGSNFVHGVRLIFERADYVTEVTSWIVQPNAFRLQ